MITFGDTDMSTAVTVRRKKGCHVPLKACQVSVMPCSSTKSGVIVKPTETSSPGAIPVASSTSTVSSRGAPSATSEASASLARGPTKSTCAVSLIPAVRVKWRRVFSGPAPRSTTWDAVTVRTSSNRNRPSARNTMPPPPVAAASRAAWTEGVESSAPVGSAP